MESDNKSKVSNKSNNNINNNSSQNRKPSYSLVKLLEIRFADPVSALKLTEHFVIMGTMMGRVTSYCLPTGKQNLLSELNSENIADISFNEEENSFYIAVGDDDILKFEVNQNSLELIQQRPAITIYEPETEHSRYCETAYIMLSPFSIFRVQLSQIEDGNLRLTKVETEYEVKNFKDRKNEKKTLSVTNYSIPLDYDGKKYLWVEFLPQDKRNVCVANIPKIILDDKPYKHTVDKQFGHISHAKLIPPGNKIFLVRKLNCCEIRMLDENFSLVEEFKHIGEEVYAVDIIIERDNNNQGEENFGGKRSRKSLRENENEKEDVKGDIKFGTVLETGEERNNININSPSGNNNVNDTNNNNKGEVCIEVGKKKTSRGNDDNNSLALLKGKSEEIYKIRIVTLDIDGNVNLYENRKERKLFNLYELNTIDQDFKDKQFFSMGYAYYIRTNLKYFCISSDHGCFIIKDDNTV